ncbi:UNVERIFIED_CONTAM: hypothetical protein GTU68_042242 [Idotea baltica]|nr:hypothetical protein [Idotea baltica]
MFAGNGGSAADAQHLSTELAGRYYLNREPLAAETLLNDPAYMTAIANDFSFEDIFARALKAKGKKEDILVAMSTSGNSENILRAIKLSKEIGVTVMAWTGSKDQKMKAYADYYLAIPSDNTPRIQEGHMLVGHIICELVEAKIFGS